MGCVGASDRICRQLVESAVDGDPQFAADRHGFWRVQAAQLADVALQQAPFTCVHMQLAQTTLGDLTVVEVAAQHLREGRRGDVLHLLVKPQVPLDSEGTRVTGLRTTDLRSGRRLPTALRRLRRFGEGSVWVAWDSSRLLSRFEDYADQIGEPVTEPDLSVSKLTAKMWSDSRLSCIGDLAARFGLQWPELRRAEPDLSALTEAFIYVLDGLGDGGVRTVAQALDFQEVKLDEVDLTGYAFDRDVLNALPQSPGVYLMKDNAGEVIYVGKAKDLRARVSPYFASASQRDDKTQGILDTLHDLEVEETATEVEAFMREAELIAEHQPRFNTQMEVHEREAPYAKGNDLVMVCPSAEGEVDVLFTAQGELLERRTIGEEELDAEGLATEIQEHYFSRYATPLGALDSDEVTKYDREIVASWIEANRDRAIIIDVHLCESAEHVAQLVVEYAADVLSQEPRSYRI